MAGILIIAHTPFASALRDCIAHIYGGLPARIGVLDIAPNDDPVQVLGQANAEVERLREENGVLVLTDLYGATPANIAARLTSLPQVRVLSGVNLPMLVRAVCYRSIPLDTLVDKALAGGAKGIQSVSPSPTPSLASLFTPCLPEPEHHAATRNDDC
jgi:PTS system mannose-specific IIA component